MCDQVACEDAEAEEAAGGTDLKARTPHNFSGKNGIHSDFVVGITMAIFGVENDDEPVDAMGDFLQTQRISEVL